MQLNCCRYEGPDLVGDGASGAINRLDDVTHTDEREIVCCKERCQFAVRGVYQLPFSIQQFHGLGKTKRASSTAAQVMLHSQVHFAASRVRVGTATSGNKLRFSS